MIFVGILIVIASVIGGFMIAGGNPVLLLHVSEFVTILGVAAGVLVIASPMHVLKEIIAKLKDACLGKAASRDEYFELLRMLYEIFMIGRRNGLIAIKLDKDDQLRWVKPTTGKDTVILSTVRGQAIHFREAAVRAMGRNASGVRGIRLHADDHVIGMDVVTNRRGGRRLQIDAPFARRPLQQFGEKAAGRRVEIEDV